MTTKWKIDPAHSEIQFKVRHLMVTNVTGYFKKFDLTVETENDDFNTADIDSIETNSEQRDAHLKSDDFFSAEKFPQLTFVSNDYKGTGDEAILNGDLTIRDVTKPIKLNVEYGGSVVDPYGQSKAGFTVTGKISRKEFGLTWGAVTEAGQVVVSDDIRILCEVQLVKQKVEELVEEGATV
jgi:polyisoprenoid-binding protein YceI